MNEMKLWTVRFKKDGQIKQRIFEEVEGARAFTKKCKVYGHPYELIVTTTIKPPSTRWERLVVFLKHGEIRWLKWRLRVMDAQIAVAVGMLLMLAYYLYMEN